MEREKLGSRLGFILISAGCFDNAVALTSSHFASSERQFRFPLEYGVAVRRAHKDMRGKFAHQEGGV